MCVSVKDAFSVSPSVCHLSSFILSLFFLAHQQSLFPVTWNVLDPLEGVRAPVDGDGNGPNHDRGEAERCIVGGVVHGGGEQEIERTQSVRESGRHGDTER